MGRCGRRCAAAAALLLLTAVTVLSGCTSTPHAAQVPSTEVAPADRDVLVVLGGTQATNSDRGDIADDWPQLVFAEVFPPGSVYVDLGADDATATLARRSQLPEVGSLGATTAVVWLGPADVAIGTPAASYREALAALVAGLRDAGVTRTILLDDGSYPDATARVAAEAGVGTDPGGTVEVVALGDVTGRRDDAGQRRIADAVVAGLR